MSAEDPSDSLNLVLAGLEARLRRRADMHVRRALEIEVRLMAGFKAAEIQATMQLGDEDYRSARHWLKEEMSELRGRLETTG